MENSRHDHLTIIIWYITNITVIEIFLTSVEIQSH